MPTRRPYSWKKKVQAMLRAVDRCQQSQGRKLLRPARAGNPVAGMGAKLTDSGVPQARCASTGGCPGGTLVPLLMSDISNFAQRGADTMLGLSKVSSVSLDTGEEIIAMLLTCNVTRFLPHCAVAAGHLQLESKVHLKTFGSFARA